MGERTSNRNLALRNRLANAREVAGRELPRASLKSASAPEHVDTYYLYSSDEKLIAEYRGDGFLQKEYVYAGGGSALAEFSPGSDELSVYLSDQIISSRLE